MTKRFLRVLLERNEESLMKSDETEDIISSSSFFSPYFLLYIWICL